MNSLREIFDIQKRQPFYRLNGDNSSFVLPSQLLGDPDKFVYVIDCQTSEMIVPVRQSRTLFGYSSNELKSAQAIYNLIDSDDADYVYANTSHAIQYMIDHVEQWVPFAQQTNTRMKFICKDGKKKILTRRCWVNGIKNGVITHTLGVYSAEEDAIKGRFFELSGLFTDEFKYRHTSDFRGVFGNREREILQLIADGYSNRKIADRLFISVRTVETHRKNMLKKLDAVNSPNLVYMAMQMKLL